MSRTPGFIARIPVRVRDRFVGAFGALWNLSLVGGLLLFTDAPWMFKLAYVLFGGLVIFFFVGVFMGKHHDPAWERRTNRVTLLGFSVFVLLGAISLFVE